MNSVKVGLYSSASHVITGVNQLKEDAMNSRIPFKMCKMNVIQFGYKDTPVLFVRSTFFAFIFHCL